TGFAALTTAEAFGPKTATTSSSFAKRVCKETPSVVSVLLSKTTSSNGRPSNTPPSAFFCSTNNSKASTAGTLYGAAALVSSKVNPSTTRTPVASSPLTLLENDIANPPTNVKPDNNNLITLVNFILFASDSASFTV